MDVLGLTWLGTRTDRHAETVGFFRDVLGLPVRSSEPGFTVLDLPDGASVEVFGPESAYNPHLTSPVAGLRVADLAQAEAELRAAVIEIVLPRQEGDTGAWLHLRAPDGHLYELTQEYPTPTA